MSTIAGVFFRDFRPVPESDQGQLRQLRTHPGSSAIQLRGAPGLILGQSPSHFDPVDQQEPAEFPEGSVCCWDGRLDNRASLLLRFGRDASRESFSPAMAALRLYDTEGVTGLRHLIGDWSLAIWDAQSKSVLLASDYAGIRPLYYQYSGDRLCWSSSLSELVRRTGMDELDEEYAARFLVTRTVPRRTPYKGIYPVPAGHAVRVSPEGISVEPFWRLPVGQQIRFQDERDYDEGLRNLFREAVQVRLPADAPVCAELSGGLDSSSVVCMCDRLLGPSYRPITLSYVHPGCKDEPYIRAVERACNLDGVHLDLAGIPLVTATQTGGAAPAWWEPRLARLASLLEDFGAGVLLTGQLGDFIMGNLGDDSEQVADYVHQFRFGQALRQAFAWSRSLQVPVYSILWKTLRSTCFSWTPPVESNAYSGPVGPFTRADSLSARMRAMLPPAGSPAPERQEWREAMPSRRRRLHMLSQILEGRTLQVPEQLQHLSYSHPYAHRPLVEYMLSIPAGQVCGPDQPRKLMRRAFASLLPTPVAARRSKAGYLQPYREALLTLGPVLLAEPEKIRVVESGFIERGSFLERLQRFSQGLECNENQLRQILLFEFWLRNREQSNQAPRRGGQALCGTRSSTLVASPGALQTERVAPI